MEFHVSCNNVLDDLWLYFLHKNELERTASCSNTGTAYNTHCSKALDIEVYLDNVVLREKIFVKHVATLDQVL